MCERKRAGKERESNLFGSSLDGVYVTKYNNNGTSFDKHYNGDAHASEQEQGPNDSAKKIKPKHRTSTFWMEMSIEK